MTDAVLHEMAERTGASDLMLKSQRRSEFQRLLQAYEA
jgi:hypothetical protein